MPDPVSRAGSLHHDDGSVLMAYEDRSGLLIRRHADLLRGDDLYRELIQAQLLDA